MSDNGPTFTSELYRKFLYNNNVKQTLIAAYHASSNGAAERLVQSFKLSINKNVKLPINLRLQKFLIHVS